MATLRDLRRKIHSVGNIRKITEAMEMVASSRLRKAKIKAEASRPYALMLKEILDNLIAASDELEHPLITARPVKKTGVVIIAGDRGLCGGYNHDVFNKAEKFLTNYDLAQVELIIIGKKSADYFEHKKWNIVLKIDEWGGKITYFQIEKLAETLMNFYLSGQMDEIWLVYTHFTNMVTRDVKIEKFLNIDKLQEKEKPHFNNYYIFEPDAPAIFAEIIPRYCITKIQAILNDAYASELAARIFSMRAATKNTEEMIEQLTLTRNKVRQSGITQELIEITSGAQSLR
jgi:F-type H+-transporting ATPase subunit gamma